MKKILLIFALIIGTLQAQTYFIVLSNDIIEVADSTKVRYSFNACYTTYRQVNGNGVEIKDNTGITTVYVSKTTNFSTTNQLIDSLNVWQYRCALNSDTDWYSDTLLTPKDSLPFLVSYAGIDIVVSDDPVPLVNFTKSYGDWVLRNGILDFTGFGGKNTAVISLSNETLDVDYSIQVSEFGVSLSYADTIQEYIVNISDKGLKIEGLPTYEDDVEANADTNLCSGCAWTTDGTGSGALFNVEGVFLIKP